MSGKTLRDQIEQDLAAFESLPEDVQEQAEADIAGAQPGISFPTHSEDDVERVALAIERADRENAPDYEGSIDHPEISDWGIHLAKAALSTMNGMREALEAVEKIADEMTIDRNIECASLSEKGPLNALLAILRTARKALGKDS